MSGETRAVALLVESVRDRVVAAFDLVESAPLPLGPDGELGAYRLWTGAAVRRLVHVGVCLPDGSMEAHMLVAQTPAGSAVPHLGVDVMRFPDGFAHFVDLIPRVDLVAHRNYVSTVYADLDPHFERFSSHPDARVVPMPPSMLAYYSPWMLHHTGLPTTREISEALTAYASRFHRLGP